MKEVKFKKGDYSFLQGNFQVVMCHYPLLTWNNKRKGTVMLHGHCHGALDKFNAWSPDLRYDVGLDSQMANLHFVKLEEIYQAAMEKRNLA